VFTAATSLIVNGPVVAGTTVDAASDTTSGCGVAKQAPEVFHQVTGNGRCMTATFCGSKTSFATSLALWNPSLCRGSCNQASTSATDCGDVNGARLTWDSLNSGVYTLAVFGRVADSTGNFGIAVSDFPNPSNDYCEQAQSLLVNDNEVLGSTVNATTRTSSGCGVTKQAPRCFTKLLETVER